LKRYTLKVQPLDDSVKLEDFEQILDDFLLRSQPPLLYRLGEISKSESGGILAEIDAEAKKDELEGRLRALESKLPLKVEGLGWGRITGKTQTPRPDPSPLTFTIGKRFDTIRYILLPVILAAFIIAAILWWRPGKGGMVDFVFLAFYIVWLALWNDTPLDFRLMMKRIDCLPGELVLTYRLRKKVVHVKWTDIWGLEMKGRTCILSTDSNPVRFHIPESQGVKGLEALTGAIAERANLNNVDTGFGKVLFKRYEAP